MEEPSLSSRTATDASTQMYVGPEFIRVMSESERDRFEADMKDVSSVFDHYRSNARAIWNTAFWPDGDFRNWDSIDQFHEIEKLLFRCTRVGKTR